MDQFNPDVELAIVLASREISKTISDRHGADYSQVFRNMSGMIRAAARNYCVDADKWVVPKGNAEWLRNADEVVQLDGEALDRAIGRWWKSLDDKSKLTELSKSYEKPFFMNLKQKYQAKPSELAQEIPALEKMYQEEMNPARVPVPSTSPAPAEVPVEEAPSA